MASRRLRNPRAFGLESLEGRAVPSHVGGLAGSLAAMNPQAHVARHKSPTTHNPVRPHGGGDQEASEPKGKDGKSDR
jgi:hypothetical protein